MKKIILISFMLMSVLINELWAQDRTVSGKVTDDGGEGIPGVNVILKGTNTGVISDIDGNYKLNVPTEGGTLVYSFIGMATQEVEIGARSVIDISMAVDATELTEIVITAQGFRKEKKTLGYGISSVDGEELVKARSTNILNGLQGKVTGVQVTSTGGNLGGSSTIIIRGITSLDGSNNPLFIVDGIPINNSQTVQNNDRLSNNLDPFNGAAILNPDDIESMSVLKGAVATALYGSRAAAGVILVTTKGAKKGAGFKVDINSTVRFDDIFIVPDFQNEYAGGQLSKYDSSATFFNFGERIMGQTVSKAVTHERVPLRAYNKNYKDFYQQGLTVINNLAFSDAGDKFNYRLSLTHLVQEGILPLASLARYTANFNASVKHNDYISTKFIIQYTKSEVKGSGGSGANDQNIVSWTRFTRSTDFKSFKPWIGPSNNQINTPNRTTNNYLWLRNENKNTRDDSRFIGNFQLIITPIKNLDIINRIGLDYEDDRRFFSNRVGTITRLQGTFSNDLIERLQFNHDLLINYTKSINDITIAAIGGFNYNKRSFRRNSLEAVNLSVPELFSPANALSTIPGIDEAYQSLIGAYGSVDITYKDYITLALTGRNDWSSTLPKKNNSYFYPSASLAFSFTDAFQIANNILSYGKLRASWAQVGNDTGPYRLLFTFTPESEADGQYGLDLNFPFQGRLGFNKTNTIPNVNLNPERQTTLEFGLELALLNGRIRLDGTYYNTSNQDQIIRLPAPESTSFAFRVVNVGEITTKGLEVSLNADIIKTNNFNWNTIVNFSSNQSLVKSLVPGVDRITLSSAFNSVQVVAVPGKELQLFAIPYLKDTLTGRPIIDPETGLRQAGEVTSMGSVLPDYTWGWTNRISYKNITLSVTIDGSKGGLIRSATVENLWTSGIVTETTNNREGTVIDVNGVLRNPDGTFRDNDVPVRSTEDFWKSIDNGSVSEATIFDASFIKLREVALFYSLPKSIIDKTPFSRVQVGAEGRNLALLMSNAPHIDPEANLFGSGSIFSRGIERNAVPSTRSWGFNIKLSF